MRKRLSTLVLVGMLGVVSACSKNDGNTNELDIKPETTETTVGDAIGQDAEIQMTTSLEEDESISDGEQTESDLPTESQTTTAKPTTTSPTTTKPTTTKPTTTKATETTKTTTTAKHTTTGQLETVEQETTTNSAMSGSSRGDVKLDIEVSDAARKRAEKITNDIITSWMSDYECVKAIHDYLVKNIDYGFVGIDDKYGSDLAHRAEGALCYDTAVCQGYAEAFELLCSCVGIQANMMYGQASSSDGYQSHAWNIVRINGEWYQIDCTWDDPLVNGNVVKDGSNIVYTYFLLTDREMYVDHVLDASLSKEAKVCSSTLFCGVGERLTLDKSMSEQSVIVKTAKSFYQAIKNYTVSKVYNFDIAVPKNENISKEKIAEAVKEGIGSSGMAGNYGLSYTSMDVGNYVVYHITISK